MELKSSSGRVFSEQQAIDLLVSLVASDANSEKKWRGFFHALFFLVVTEATVGVIE